MKRKFLAIGFVAGFFSSICTVTFAQEVYETFPKRFEGDDLARLLVKVRAASKVFGERGEFESSADYKERVSSAADKQANSKSVFIVLRAGKNLSFSYDPDYKLMSISPSFEAVLVGNVQLGERKKVTGSYVGMNSYGARSRISKVENTAIDFSYDKDLRFALGNGLFSGSLRPANFVIKVEPLVAEQLKQNVSIVLEVGIEAPFYNRKLLGGSTPTVNEPVEQNYYHETIYGNIRRISVVNFSTGKVYRRFIFPDDIDLFSKKYEKFNRCKTYSPMISGGCIQFNIDFKIEDL